MITISQEELVEYHNNVYLSKFKENQGGNFKVGNLLKVQNVSKVVKRTDEKDGKSETEEMDATFSVNELVADSETFERRIDTNLEEALKDQRVLQYLDGQKSHRQNFLEEVHKKGLTMRKDSKTDTKIQRQPMNY